MLVITISMPILIIDIGVWSNLGVGLWKNQGALPVANQPIQGACRTGQLERAYRVIQYLKLFLQQ